MGVKYSMGIMNYCSHDPACALIKVDGSDIDMIFAEEGFLSRKKKSYQFPIRSIKYCLDYFGIKMSDVDVLTVDFMDHRRFFKTSNNYRLLIGDYFRSKLKIDVEKINYVESHHYAHALTAFWPSGFSEAAVLVVDGLGSEQQTHSVYYMDSSGMIDRLYEQKGVGIGSLYSLGTSALGFESGEEGKTMGLAPYGRDQQEMDKDLPDLKGDFNGFMTDYSKQIWRNPSPQLKFSINSPKSKKDIYEPYFSRFAYNLQKETERCLLHLANEALSVTRSKNLCFAGGVALNCVANNCIQNLNSLDSFWIQPAAGDTGIPIGLALAGLEKLGFKLSELLTPLNRKKLSIPYSIDKAPLETLYKNDLNLLLVKHKIKTSKLDSDLIAKKIEDKMIVALFSSGIELGPRALGHRSFLADSRSSEMKELLNKKIKHREGYRPFAPMVLKEDFNLYFDSKVDDHPYMLQAPFCKEKALLEVPAICHVDETARVQTITKEAGFVYEILKNYKKNTNVSVIINTSFNDNDEPIVFTKLDAVCSFLRCNADVLILEDSFLERKDILNIVDFRLDLEKLQKKLREEYFLKAIEELTFVSLEENVNNLINFIFINNKLSNAYNDDRILNNLIDFLFNRNNKKMLYLDEYHFTKISQLLESLGHSFSNVIGKFTIIDDTFLSGSIMDSNSEFILYNFSAYFYNIHLKNEIINFNTISSFYHLQDKIIKVPVISFSDHREKLNFKSCVLKSYENDLQSNISEFFDFVSDSTNK